MKRVFVVVFSWSLDSLAKCLPDIVGKLMISNYETLLSEK